MNKTTLLLIVASILAVGCQPTPMATPLPTAVPPTATILPTATPPPPTATATIAPSTPTPLPPTASPTMPVATAVPNKAAPQLIGSYSLKFLNLSFTAVYRLVLDADGTFFVTWRGSGSDGKKAGRNDGVYTIKGDQISFVDFPIADACPPKQNPGVYQWTLDGKQLVFKPINDPCLDRTSFLLREIWTRE